MTCIFTLESASVDYISVASNCLWMPNKKPVEGRNPRSQHSAAKQFEGMARGQYMSTSLLVGMPLLGAALPLLVTQISNDKDLRAIGRAALKYALAMPLALVLAVVAATTLVA
jgi:hypothetical protein